MARITENKTKILFVTRSLEYGGTDRHTLDLLGSLAEHEVELSVLCLGQDYYSGRLRHPNIEVRSDNNVKSFWQWFRVLRNTRPDVVVFVRSWLWCFPWYTCAAAWLAAIPRRCSVIHIIHPTPVKPTANICSLTGIAQRLSWLRRLLSTRRVAIGCTSTICVCDAVRSTLVNCYRFPEHSTTTVHNGVAVLPNRRDTQGNLPLRRQLGVEEGDFLFVCVARLTAQKRIDVLLAAMAQLLREGVQCKCAVALDVNTKDEVGRMAEALNRAVEKLGSTLQEVADSAVSASSSSQQLAGASQAIASGAQEQAASLEETSASLEEISGAVRQSADNATKASDLACGSRQTADRGQEGTSAVSAMADISAASAKISEIISTGSIRSCRLLADEREARHLPPSATSELTKAITKARRLSTRAKHSLPPVGRWTQPRLRFTKSTVWGLLPLPFKPK